MEMENLMISANQKNAEWLETDGLGGFATGTVSGIRSRRYHALLLAATAPPSGRMVLVNGFDAWVETDSGSYPITSQKYAPDVIHPEGIKRLENFQSEPWPRWSFLLEDGRRIEQEIFTPHNSSTVVVIWRWIGNANGVNLRVRPFLSGRDYHSLHHENSNFNFQPEINGQQVAWQPYDGVPKIIAFSNATYFHEPSWYRNFLYTEEQSRGLDFTEDLASPGTFRFDLTSGPAILLFTTESNSDQYHDLKSRVEALKQQELERRNKFAGTLDRAADSYIVKRQQGKTIIAGYPWFTDWGRDTLIALRGLAISTDRLEIAEQILSEWAGTISEGMLPNRFPDSGSEPEFNSVDASLWFIIAIHDFFKAAKLNRYRINNRKALQQAADAILTGYSEGTRYQIHMDNDCLIAAGQPGVQLTWMDAKIGDWVVTPRIGKPVEIQALWLNALRIASEWSAHWLPLYKEGCENFRKRFWNPDGSYLYDVIDVDHIPGKIDSSFRPNQIFAVGGLPFPILTGEQALKVVNAVEAKLLTPLGLRSLAPGEPGYIPHYQGGVRERDAAYHQGTVWPWLIGAFVEAWIAVRGGTNAAKMEARTRFLTPLLQHLDEAGLGHVSEIADGDSPHTPRGCPFQAWSVGEVLRLMSDVLVEEKAPIEKAVSK
jgi:predicted glycogen debranching enzyme